MGRFLIAATALRSPSTRPWPAARCARWKKRGYRGRRLAYLHDYVEGMAKHPEPPGATFETTISSFGNNTGIVVPPEAIDQLGAGKRPAVVVTMNGYEFRTTIGVMGGQCLISVSAAIRKETGLKGGDHVRIAFALAEGPRPVNMPEDFQSALNDNAAAKKFFDSLSNSVQRYHVDNIISAKAPATRQRRIDHAVDLFLSGKAR